MLFNPAFFAPRMSVSSRSPTAAIRAFGRSSRATAICMIAGYGFPMIFGRMPLAAVRAARIAPFPCEIPRSVGKVTSPLVPMRRAPWFRLIVALASLFQIKAAVHAANDVIRVQRVRIDRLHPGQLHRPDQPFLADDVSAFARAGDGFQILRGRRGRSKNFLRSGRHAHPGKFLNVARDGQTGVVGRQDEPDFPFPQESKKVRHPRQGRIALPEDSVHIQDQAAQGGEVRGFWSGHGRGAPTWRFWPPCPAFPWRGSGRQIHTRSPPGHPGRNPGRYRVR